MSPFDYYLDVFKNKYADFSGRARRSEYWYFFLFNMIAMMAATVVDGVLGYSFFYFIYGLAAFVPGLAVSVRRLHDTGRSGWFLLISIIPIIGAIILLVFMVQDSAPGANEYGSNPKDPDYLEDDIVDHLID